ncbi:MAG: hypothetical protein ACF8LK_05820, partial [Phycisphaerales bacterium JB041]
IGSHRMSTTPPTDPAAPVMRPHRGSTVLTLGILGLVFNAGCGIGWILGLIAWTMANGDLKSMDAHEMDPTGRGLTQGGKVCGIISVVMGAVGMLATIAYVVIVVVFGIAILGGAAGAAGP